MDIDLAAFSEDSFNADDWINKHFKDFENEEDRRLFKTNVISKLQLYEQQVKISVEDSSQEIIANLPRVIHDVKKLYGDVHRLQERMEKLRCQMTNAQEETSDCMENLIQLDDLQTKMQKAKESLQQSDGWGNLLSELEDCFERGELLPICDKLILLQKSLAAQEMLEGHSERSTQVEDFKNRFEALASPNIVQAFSIVDLENSRKFVEMFKNIQRLSQLMQYYRAVQKNSVQQQWKEILDLGDISNQFLTTFYESLIETCKKQIKWCIQVFGDDAADQPFVVVAELLPVLQPTRDEHILQILKSSNEKLDALQIFATANQTFVTQLKSLLESFSITLNADQYKELAESIFEYFSKFIQQYPRIEETNLSNQIDKLITSHSNPSDSIRHLDDCVRKVFEWLYETSQRCTKITNDLAIVRIINLLGGIFKRLLDNFAKTQRQVNLSIANPEQNWNLLQNCMCLLQSLSDFQNKLNKFEKHLHERMSLLDDKISSPKSTINIYTAYDRNELKRLITNIRDFKQKRNAQLLSFGIFPQTYESLKSNFIETHDITLTILLFPIEQQLRNIQPIDNPNNVVGVDLPTFSIVPQECITQIGQYLLTLPQHLEPLLLAPSALLKIGLQMCSLKYTQNTPCADVLLSLVVEQCCVMYQSQILQIKSINSAAAKQLAVDIEYLENVVEELGLGITQHLSQILALLKASPENYLALSSGCEPRLVTAIRQMRNIISSE